MPTWPQFAPQLGPKNAPKSFQQPSEIHPKSHLVFDRFLDRFWIDFLSISDCKINQKSIKIPSKRGSKTRCKLGWILDGSWIDFWSILGSSWGSSWGQVGTKIGGYGVPRRCQKIIKNLKTQGYAVVRGGTRVNLVLAPHSTIVLEY